MSFTVETGRPDDGFDIEDVTQPNSMAQGWPLFLMMFAPLCVGGFERPADGFGIETGRPTDGFAAESGRPS